MSRILANLVVQVNAASVAVPPPRPPSSFPLSGGVPIAIVRGL